MDLVAGTRPGATRLGMGLGLRVASRHGRPGSPGALAERLALLHRLGVVVTVLRRWQPAAAREPLGGAPVAGGAAHLRASGLGRLLGRRGNLLLVALHHRAG